MKALAILFALSTAAAAGPVSGTAVLDDGEPPLAPIAVKLRCDGRIVAESEADAAGHFELQWGGSGVACRVEAYHAGYTPAVLPVSELPASAAIPSLALHRTGKAQGQTISATFLAAPPEARRAFEEGYILLRAGDYEAGQEAFERAVGIDPGYAAAWFELARLSLASDDLEKARTRLAKAVSADPWFVPPYEPLMLLDMQAGRWRSVRSLADRMLAMNPHLPAVRYRRAVAAVELGDVAQAREDLKELTGDDTPGLDELRKRLEQEARK